LTSLDASDPIVSAVVEMHAPGELESSDPDEYQRATSKLKAHFTSAGFEVHAPFHTSFSIGAKVSQFQDYFGEHVVVEEGLVTSVTVEGGKAELDRDKIPEDVAGIVKSVFFMPPPDFVPR
jgi:hypothetical protein